MFCSINFYASKLGYASCEELILLYINMSSNETASITHEDLNLIQILEPFYSGFIYVLFVFKFTCFIFLFFLLSRVHSKVLQGYRFYLSINVTTTFLFGFFFVLWQPVILMPDVIFCDVGLVSRLGNMLGYVLLFRHTQ